MLTALAATLSLTLAALVLEAAAGYPQPVYRAIGHPVTWMGRLISVLDSKLNRQSLPAGLQRAAGVLGLAALLLAAGIPAVVLQAALSGSFAGTLALVLCASSLLAQNSLDTHVRAVAEALENDGLEAGRKAVSMIVGRNTKVLDEAGVSRAAIESLAENFADGVVAPAFWMGVGGVPGAALYKAVNTADSMIGHRTPRHLQYGWASARLDDLVNLPASRLAALWLVLAACVVKDAAPRQAWQAVWRDAGKHRSPNAGWPEAAMAGALGLALAGPRQYGTEWVEDALMGDGRRSAGGRDIRRALTLYRVACGVQLAAIATLIATLSALA